MMSNQCLDASEIEATNWKNAATKGHQKFWWPRCPGFSKVIPARFPCKDLDVFLDTHTHAHARCNPLWEEDRSARSNNDATVCG